MEWVFRKPQMVEFRRAINGVVQVIEVRLSTSVPRISSYTLFGGGKVKPLPLPFHLIKCYLERAQKELQEMKELSKKVTSEGNVVGVAKFVNCDSLEEAVSHFGDKKVLDFVNRQHKTDSLNAVRQSAGKPTKAQVKDATMAFIAVNHQEELSQAAIQGTDAVAELIESYIPEVEKQMEEERQKKLAEMRSEAENTPDTDESEGMEDIDEM